MFYSICLVWKWCSTVTHLILIHGLLSGVEAGRYLNCSIGKLCSFLCVFHGSVVPVLHTSYESMIWSLVFLLLCLWTATLESYVLSYLFGMKVVFHCYPLYINPWFTFWCWGWAIFELQHWKVMFLFMCVPWKCCSSIAHFIWIHDLIASVSSVMFMNCNFGKLCSILFVWYESGVPLLPTLY